MVSPVVSVVVVAAARPAGPDPNRRSVTVAVQLARDLEGQARYDAAARMYREASRCPDDAIRLRSPRCRGLATTPARHLRVLVTAPQIPDGLPLGLAARQPSAERRACDAS
jgi:hypothetical protein